MLQGRIANPPYVVVLGRQGCDAHAPGADCKSALREHHQISLDATPGGSILTQLRKQCSGCAQIMCVEAFSEPIVLDQGGAALPIARQQEHQLAMGGFPPRLDLEEAPGGVDAGAPAPLLDAALHQPGEDLHHPFALATPLSQHPQFEVRRILHLKALQQVTSIELCRFGELPGCESRLWWTLSMQPIDGGLEFVQVQPVIAPQIESNLAAFDDHVIADLGAQFG